MTPEIGSNSGFAAVPTVAGILAYVERIESLEARSAAILAEQKAVMREIGQLLWHGGWHGRDGRRLPNPMDRFVNRFSSPAETTCWEWHGTPTDAGYGLFGFDGKYVLAHRWSVWATKGLSGDIRKVVDHKCRNRTCVNPVHLEEVTQSINVLRGIGPALTRERLTGLTHCRHGHPFTAENTYRAPRTGGRSCRVCGTKRKLAWQRKNRDGK